MLDLFRAALNLPVLALVLCRTSGIMIAAPLLSSVSIPRKVKAAIATLLALMMAPFAAQYHGPLPGGVIGYVPLVATEFGLGLIIGFAGSLVLAAAHVAGALASQQIGMRLAEVAAPDTPGGSNAVGVFLGMSALLLFLAVDGHHWFVEVLAVSYRDVPLGTVEWNPRVAASVEAGFRDLFICGLKVAAPIMGIMFLVTVMIAVIGKSVPQMRILMVGYPVKVFIGVFSMMLTFPLIWPVMRDAFQGLHSGLGRLLQLF